MKEKYLFTSDRIGFRTWLDSDIEVFHEINENPKVMQYFPRTLSRKESLDFIQNMNQHQHTFGYCYFAARLLDTDELIGFIGLKNQTYEVDFNPSTDIGWRLHPDHWHQGFATEGANRCLAYAFDSIGLDKVVAVAPKINQATVNVMKKLGMQFSKEFVHPLMDATSTLQPCVLYEIYKPNKV